jgi:hypothetical protein
MKLQRTFICMAGVFFAVGLAASQAAAGTGTPGCGTVGPIGVMSIEVNALRAGGKTIVTSPNDTTSVTAKARIEKGSAPTDSTIEVTLEIEAVDGETVIGEASTEIDAITLGVGKGGKGAKLLVPTEQCESGTLDFIARFWGLDEENDLCEGFKTIHKACR